MKRILGLDLGTNSIGWAVTLAEEIEKDGKITLQPYKIEDANSRIIPMDAAILGKFDLGDTVSQTANRTDYRGTRRLRERSLLRRERLHRILDLMGFLPEHYSLKLDRYGKFIDDSEPKLPWRKDALGEAEFLFMDSFIEMSQEFNQQYPGIKIPYDWTIYYLRKKALTKPISKYELAWILLNFNQKRGYYQLRGEDDIEDKTKDVKFYALKVVKVEATEEKKGNDIWYNVHLENGMVYRRLSSIPLDWVGKIKDFIITTELNEDGTPKTNKDGEVKRSFRAPKEEDWNLLKVKTESDIENSHKTIGCYIYDNILLNPQQKINGKLVRTIERKFYKEELRQIIEKQKEFIPELTDGELYNKCIEELYPNNESHRNNIAQKDFTYLFINDIIFYQRPLKSKKSLVSDCPYETRVYKKKDKNGDYIKDDAGNDKLFNDNLKCIAKSNPLFQEFRLWQFISNLKIYQKEKVVDGKLCVDVDVTSEFLKNENDIVDLFDWLNNRKEVDQKAFLKYEPFGIKKQIDNYRWNYVEEESYKCNETRNCILGRLNKVGVSLEFLTKEREESLWHILYSVEDKQEIKLALGKYASKHSLPESFVDEFSKMPPFEKEYGSYSEKAIKKLLPLMRMGKYWEESAIDDNTRVRIEKILTGEYDEKIKDRVREKTINLTDISQFKGLPLWLACYVVYDRHSEAREITKWESPDDIDAYLKKFKQHSLRNPIVEQVVTETLRIVRDIWRKYGRIDEIHVELGREMKNPADKRKMMTTQILENENTNLRIKSMLAELINPEYEVENVRPYSPMQQEILKIYEEYAIDNLDKNDKDFDFVSKVSKNPQPSKSDIVRYKAWLEQKYRSPYTGKTIPLGKLFTSAYQIEHVIPQSRYFDDSFSNKVICEAEINQLKDRELGYEFIKKHRGEKVQLAGGEIVEVFSVESYEDFVKRHYKGIKKTKLLMEDIPDKFIERQLNDSRYISKLVKGLLSNIVREKDEQEAVSKHVITCNGTITDRLKKDWGVNNVWNKIILPRFERLNELTGTNSFTAYNTEGHLMPEMPLELQKGFNKKRIDHRHHALDAIVIACTTRDHVNLLNNEAAHSKHNANRYQLSRKLRKVEKVIVKGKEQEVFREFYKPWETFTSDVQKSIENMIVSFKQNLRVINKTVNKYEHYDENGKKVIVKQTKGDSWAIRKSMHKATIWGEINLRFKKELPLVEALKNPKRIVNSEFKEKVIELLSNGYDAKYIKKYVDENKDIWADIDIKKIEVYYFTNETNDRYFATRFLSDLVGYMSGINDYDKAVKKINGITDTGIQKILLAHLHLKDNNPEIAFSPDGIDEMNKNIVELNSGKFHHPIYKVRRFEKGNKFAIGKNGNKSVKFAEADDGTNLFFAVYSLKKENKKTGEVENLRKYATAPLNLVIDCQKSYQKEWKQALDNVLKENEYVDKDAKLLFILSPNDLVYVPSSEDMRNGIECDVIDKSRIYKFVDSSGIQANFVPSNIAKAIFSITKDDQNKMFGCCKYNIQNEIGVGSRPSKSQNAITGEMIKEICIPIKVDRLGNIVEFNNLKQ